MQLDDACNLEVAASLYTGELLEGFYYDWALRERERLRYVYLNSLAHLMQFYRRQRLYDKGLEAGRKILDLDPLHEEIHREMMQLYAESGQRALAIRQYESCCDSLHAELGILPMDETQALYTQIAPESCHPGRSAPARVLPSAWQPLKQLRMTLRNLDRVHDQLQQTIQLMEKWDGRSEGTRQRSDR
jgi:DNA-binding SARP family transcriptional activator